MTQPALIAHYRISSKLGEGGMGAVYRATDTKLNREVAIKVLPDALAQDPDRMARFTREAQVLASLNHPNIAAIYGVEDRAIVMELVEGTSPAGPMSEEEALPLVHQLIDALEYAHERGVVHRDLKPANLKVTPDGRLKVLDFGLAKALSSETAQPDPASSPTMTMRATMAGVIMGTAAYMSPEQARGQAVDRRADIWAFGVVVHELLSGRQLFGGETVSDTLAAVLRQEPDLGAVPARFRRLLGLCLARDPRQRLRDISGARLLLEEEAPAAPASGRPRIWMAVATGLAVVTAVALGIAWRATRPVDKPLVRFNVDLGPDAVIDSRNVFALSPDGKRMVFTARGPSGSQVLATRLFDQTRVDLLRGTEGAGDPFFSPDGEWVGFFADGKLRKVSILGGAPVTLAELAPTPRGGSWGEDGSIVFTPRPASPLMRLPASGGSPEKLTDPPGRKQATHRWPQFLPGGRALIFTAHSATNGLDDAEIDVLEWKTRQWKTVQRGGYFGRYLPSGHLVFAHDGKLFAVRFDLDRLETRGTPVPVLEDLAANVVTAAGRFDFAGSVAGGSALAYISGRPDLVAARTVWLDADGKTEAVPFAEVAAGGALSPDGRRVALSSGGIGTQNISVWDMDREVRTAITSNSRSNISPVWAPDGRHIVYTSYFNQTGSLWWARADGGGEPHQILEVPTVRPSPRSFSPDGKRLAYHVTSAETGEDLWMLPLDLRDPDNPKPGIPEPFVRTNASEVLPVFSPDGRWVAYTSLESGVPAIYVRPYPGPGGRWQISSADGAWVQWRRKGGQLLYATVDGRVMAVDYEVKGDTFVPGKARPWTETRISSDYGLMSFDLTSDGKRLLTTVRPTDKSESATVHVTFLLNFLEELKRRVP